MRFRRSPQSIRRSLGLSMIELLVALAVGSVVIVGAVYVYDQSRRTYTTNDNVARIQEQARFAMSLVETELQLAGYYGYINNPSKFRFRTATTDTEDGIEQMRQSNATAAPLPAAAHACGRNFAIDLLFPVQGSNDAYVLGEDATAACDPQGGGHLAGTDTLTVRRAATTWEAAVDVNRLQIVAARLGEGNNMLTAEEAALDKALNTGMYELRNLVVRTFYVAQNSDGFPGVPALRMRSLRNLDDADGAFSDDELAAGVEDMQIQFGIDTGSYDGDDTLDNPVATDPYNGQVTRYVEPDHTLVDPLNEDAAQIVAVRIWLRVRGDVPEVGFTDGRTYSYAGVNYTPAGEDARFRRMLVSRTILMRNVRTF